MRHPRQIAPFIAALVLLLASILPIAAQTPVAIDDTLYIGHHARITATMPADWSYDTAIPYAYSGEDGFVTAFGVTGTSLTETCATFATISWTEATTTEVTWNDAPACQVDGTFMNRPANAIVIPLPHPFAINGQIVAFASITTDLAHFDAITSTVSFEPNRVTPSAYLASVIDIVEAHAYVSGDIDWEFMRPILLNGIESIDSVEAARASVASIVSLLYAYGDNHSFILFPDQANALQVSRGFGMVVGGTRIIALFPDGPAAKAGLQVGDIVRTVNGFTPTNLPGIDPGLGYNPNYSWPMESTLTVERPGEPKLVEATLSADEFEYYRPPVGQSLQNGLGYIDIPGYRIPGREVEFSQTGIDLLTTIDRQQPTCGWMVDLRLNFGGSYSPMVSAISPLVGNGIFVGWQDRANHTTWITMDNGTVTSDGMPVSQYLSDTGPDLLTQPSPPIAVLTSGQTSSSGEVTTLAFVGNPNARLFGATTAGRTTANEGFSLFDGATLALASAAMVDRDGQTYLPGIPPDQTIAIDWTTYGTAEDPVLNAAQEWLLQQPACTAPQASPVPAA